MADVCPIRGVRYNSEKTSDLAAVICPPYDIISDAGQKALYERNPYNFVRIEYGEICAGDNVDDNRYTRAGAYLQEWLSQGVLTQDNNPAFYVHDHYFTYQGKEYCRRGLACRVRLEEWERGVVRPHEKIIAAHKGDRMRLLETLGANTSPVMAMYQDLSGEIARILAEIATGTPIAVSSSLEGERHEFFSTSDLGQIERLQRAFTDLSLYIADGHHRYESALAYLREQAASHPDVSAEAPYNFVLMTLMDTDDSGLLILPTHRLLRGLSPARIEALETGLPSFFDIQEVSSGASDVWAQVDALKGGCRLVIAGPGQALRILNLRDLEAAACLMPTCHTDLYRKLDVSVVDHVVLEKILGLKADDEATVAFNYDRNEALRMVRDGEYQLAFIMQPVRPETIKNIADAGDRMPRKSTYFYPKLPSGLLVNRVA